MIKFKGGKMKQTKIFLTLVLIFIANTLWSVHHKTIPGIISIRNLSTTENGSSAMLSMFLLEPNNLQLIKVFNPITGELNLELVKNINLNTDPPYFPIYITPDGKDLIGLQTYYGNEDSSKINLIKIKDLDLNKTQIHTLGKTKPSPTKHQFSPNLKYLYYILGDSIFVVYDVEKNKFLHNFYKNSPHWGYGINFTSDSRYLTLPMEKSLKVWDFVDDTVIMEVPTPYNHFHTAIMISPDLTKILYWYGLQPNFYIFDAKTGDTLYTLEKWVAYFGNFTFSYDGKRFYSTFQNFRQFAKVDLSIPRADFYPEDEPEPFMTDVFNYTFSYFHIDTNDFTIHASNQPLDNPSVLLLFDPRNFKVLKILSPFVFKFTFAPKYLSNIFKPLFQNYFILDNLIYQYTPSEFKFVRKLPDNLSVWNRFYLVLEDSIYSIKDIFTDYTFKTFNRTNFPQGYSIDMITDNLKYALLKKQSGTNIELNLFDLESFATVKTWLITKSNSIYVLSRFGNYIALLDSTNNLTIHHIPTDSVIFKEQINHQPLIFRFSHNENNFYFGTKNQPIKLIQLAPKLSKEEFEDLICNNSSLFLTADNKYFVGYADTSLLHFILYDIENRKKVDEKIESIDTSKKVFTSYFPGSTIFFSATEHLNFNFYELSDYVSSVENLNTTPTIPLKVKQYQNKLIIEFYTNVDRFDISICNLFGQVLLKEKYHNTDWNNKITLNLPDVIPSGIYVVSIKIGNEVYFEKIIKVN